MGQNRQEGGRAENLVYECSLNICPWPIRDLSLEGKKYTITGFSKGHELIRGICPNTVVYKPENIIKTFKYFVSTLTSV